LAIILDGESISEASVGNQFASTGITGGSATISGNFSAENARELEVQLKGGSLPLPIEIVETNTIGALLGSKNIFKSWEEKYKNNKLRKFKNVNPQIIPRNHIIEEIINEVYSNNYSQLYEFEKLLKNPYEKIENKKYITPPLESEKVFETFCGT